MGRLAIVTGGTRGIGASISLALHNLGYKVVASYASQSETAKAFHEETGIYVKKWDVSHYESCAKAVEEIEEKFGQKVAILVNNAGITRDSMLHKMEPSDWGDVINTNLTSCFNMCRSVINSMRGESFGRIVNISSVNGIAGQAGQTNYSAAKAGVIGFTKALARESASKNITVNAIAPGYIMTDMVSKISADILDKIVALTPIPRLGRPDEIARAVAFLVDDEAGFITGETISINGGRNMA
ncbi:MAG: acetoacetyl-CoA reductase [Rickettsiaceae bacterium]|nr:acetoacetyl-CoA reductase [Rickettsiaceae bacterium]